MLLKGLLEFESFGRQINESRCVDFATTSTYKQNDEINAGTLTDCRMTNEKPQRSANDRLAEKMEELGDSVSFEKNQVDEPPQPKPKKKLKLEEYLKRRPNLRLNSSKKTEVKVEANDWAGQSNQTTGKENNVNLIQDLYEEIIVMSMGTNTDVTIPFNDNLYGDIESIKLITDTIAGEHIPSNSLIASIRDVIIKKNSLNCLKNIPKTAKNENAVEHGEDKTIMHLRKDRVRVKNSTIGVQTDFNIRFPPLETLKVLSYTKSVSRSPSTSSRTSYSSFVNEKRKKSKFRVPL